jgi:acetoin utilization deacetylase AcuC-like enzyme
MAARASASEIDPAQVGSKSDGRAMTELLLVEQRPASSEDDGAHWILEGGRILPGVDDNRRMEELRRGLLRHAGVRAAAADADSEEVEQTLSVLHEPHYLEALGEVSGEPVVMPELTPPGLPPDIPVSSGLVEAAREGVRTAVTAAERLAGGARFTYALCRPPGHHAGPTWFAGYCYLNTAAAAVQTLRQAGVRPVGILDIDLHYPNGTAAIVESMGDASLHSLHASPVTNVAAGTVAPSSEREVAVEFVGSPEASSYLEALASSIDALAQTSAALVVSLGYDIVAGDPHGSWAFEPAIFTEIGAMLAASGLAVCVIQEGGYALSTLAECSEAFATGLLDSAPDRSGAPYPRYAGIRRTGSGEAS